VNIGRTAVEISIACRRRDMPRDGVVVAVGAIRCFEPQVVANHLLGLKNSKLRADMGLCLHWLQPTTGLRGTNVTAILVSLLLIFLAFLQVPLGYAGHAGEI
jgi:hypothetical protein